MSQLEFRRQKLQAKVDELLMLFTQSESPIIYCFHLDEALKSVIDNITSSIEIIVQMTKKVLLLNYSTDAELMLRVAKFFKQCVDSWNVFMITRTKEEILPIICEILNDYAMHDISSNESEEQLMILLSECVFVWSKWFIGAADSQSDSLKLAISLVNDKQTLTFFKEMDVLYRDVESFQASVVRSNDFIFENGELSSEHFLCTKQGKMIGSKILTRIVTFVGNGLFQLEGSPKKGEDLRPTKSFGLPDHFLLQSREEYHQARAAKLPSKLSYLKLTWEDSLQKQFPFRLICQRADENRWFALYCDDLQKAIKLRDYLITKRLEKKLKHIRESFCTLALNYKQTLAHQYNEKVIISAAKSAASTRPESLEKVPASTNNTSTTTTTAAAAAAAAIGKRDSSKYFASNEEITQRVEQLFIRQQQQLQ